MSRYDNIVGQPLTDRQIEILEYIAQGESDNKIGSLLFLSANTIGSHVTSILAKLDAKSRSHAVSIGYQTGLLRVLEPAT